MNYNYIKTPVAIDSLKESIQLSSIITALDYITYDSGTIHIYFKDSLSVNDKSTLDTLVANHTGEPLPENKKSIVEITSIPATASKTLSNGKKLFKRVHGVQQLAQVGTNTIEFICPHPWVKFLGIEFFWASEGTSVNLEIHDTPTGAYSGVPNYKLNQFGFNANIAPEFYSHKSEFDADLYQGMVIKIIYISSEAKTIGINFIMNEVKD
jgi:hypothetical protein